MKNFRNQAIALLEKGNIEIGVRLFDQSYDVVTIEHTAKGYVCHMYTPPVDCIMDEDISTVIDIVFATIEQYNEVVGVELTKLLFTVYVDNINGVYSVGDDDNITGSYLCDDFEQVDTFIRIMEDWQYERYIVDLPTYIQILNSWGVSLELGEIARYVAMLSVAEALELCTNMCSHDCQFQNWDAGYSIFLFDDDTRVRIDECITVLEPIIVAPYSCDGYEEDFVTWLQETGYEARVGVHSSGDLQNELWEEYTKTWKEFTLNCVWNVQEGTFAESVTIQARSERDAVAAAYGIDRVQYGTPDEVHTIA